MKETKLSKRAKDYMKRIEACTSRTEIERIRIGFSCDCSAYHLTWEEFIVLLHAQQAKRSEIRGGR